MRCPRCGTPLPLVLKPDLGWVYMYSEVYTMGEWEYSIERYICPDCDCEGGRAEDTELWWF
ncbi:MAG: hypothetical protein GF416_06575 [Candidatus Altiarchaeales archaeon]|nr:hypothetical protein [Candidatus Altiarchaeales archaeon]MBD3416780.1 hypothetical protein [Candidatus Altiarchaeales archaeon]